MVLRKVTNRRLLHRLALAAVILLAAAAGMSATGGSWRIAPLNPAFVAYARDRAAGNLTATGAEERGLGYIPAPVDLSHLSGQRLLTADQLSLPASFDLRATGKLTPVKDQGDCGSCWAFATYASMESNLLPGESRDFSENNMKNTHGFDWAHYDGGNHFMSTAYLTRWSGPVDEADDPYDPSSGDSPPGLPARKHVQEVIFLPDRSGPLDNDAIKQAVMTYGAVFTSMYYSSSYYNAATYSYYCSSAVYGNHAVAIVGWDDSYDRYKFTSVPAGDGAFIIKNSWGPDWGEAGYFYVSYYDAIIGKSNALFLNAEPITNYERVYQYDPLGWTASVGYETDTIWATNVFTAVADEELSGVGFYSTGLNTTYELYIYTNVDYGQPESGTLMCMQSGTIPMPGFHQVRLSTRVPVGSGWRFSVVVKLTTPGYDCEFAIEHPISGYSSQATSNSGESYISREGSDWFDIGDINGNICIKAYSTNKTAIPEFSPDGGSFAEPQDVTITCSTIDAQIYYTTDGSEPSMLDSKVVSGSTVRVDQSMVLRARAYKDGWSPSVIKSAEYNIDSTIGTCPAPSISPGSGVYTSPQTVSLTSLNNGAEIRYTLNGDEPTAADTLYEGPIVIDTPGTTLKAKVFKAGWQPSDTRSETYDFVTANPVIMPPGGLYHSAQSIVLSCATPGAEIRYTTDGSDPDAGSALYQDSILLTTAATVKARAFYAGWPMSGIVSATYDYIVATPTISPAGGTYSNPLSVKMTCATPGAAIHYTIDGTEPNLSSHLYQSALSVNTPMTIKAKAFKEGWPDSKTSENSYYFKVSKPIIHSSSTGYYPVEQDIGISCSTREAKIYYTIDGSEPTTASLLYSGTFSVNKNTTIKVRAFREGWIPSDIKTVSVTFTPAFPVLTPTNATANTVIHVKASCSTPETELRYTLDGTEPSPTSALYSGEIAINTSSVLQVKAFRTGWNPSATATGNYSINHNAVLPESPHPYPFYTDSTWIYRLSGSHRAVNVTFASECEVTPHEDMIYVMDGSGNNIAGSPYTGHALAGKTILVPGDTVMIQLKGTNSNGDYYGFKVTSIVDAQVAAPTSSLIGGTYSSSQAVTLTCPTPGATIHYTTDGREPTESDPKVMSGGTLIIGRSTYLRAKAFKDGWLPSQTWCAEYIITGTNGVVAAPDIFPNGGTMIAPGMASISCVAPGAEIRYTTDGSEPIASSPVYTAPIPIEGTMTLKARAFKEGWTASPIVSATYKFVPGKYVNSSATGPVLDGSSWQNAYRTVQEAINNASAGSEIWVAAGIYNERITLKEGVALYGGFAGDEIIREQRDWRLNYAILDGSNRQANVVVTATNGLTNTARLDGFVVRKGYMDGIYISGASPVIVNNNIYGNGSSYGSGIYCSSPSAVIEGNFICDNEENGICVYGDALIKNNYISTNRGGFGGGISCQSGSPQIIGNTIVWNWESSTAGGAGISCSRCSGPVLIANNLIGWNYTQYGAGISCDNSNAAIINNTIVGNSFNYGSGYGNGIFLDADSSISKNVLIANNIIAFNSAGIKVDTDAKIVATLRNNCVYGNNGYDYENIYIGIGDFSADPAFVDHDHDLHLLVTSPCLNRGDNGDIQIAWADLDGKPRLQGATVDVGAYECSTVACPALSPEGGAASGPISVLVNCFTPGASLYYSTNGDEPTTSDPSIASGAAVTVDRSMVLKVKAYKDGWSPSETSGAEYLITGTTGTVASPVVDTPGGTYAREQTVTITCANIGAAIHYTLDGSDPTEASPLYQGPITISEDNTTLKARAFKPGWIPSAIVSAVYNLTVATPVFTPDSGTFNTEQSVAISCATPGAEIRYTSDGTEPTMASALYMGPVAITVTTTLKAKAFKPGMADSQTKSADFELKVQNLTFNPAGGTTYNKQQNVSITCPRPDAIIRYTVDGSDPTETSLVYSTPVSIGMPTTLKARAYKAGWSASEIMAADYGFKAATPSFHRSSGTYTDVFSTSIYCATIRYTIDGSDPTAESTLYTGSVAITRSIVLKARAFVEGWAASDIAIATYTMKAPAPIMKPATGQSNTPQDVVISCSLAEAEIRYTLDGSTPTASSSLYSGPVRIEVSTVVNAKAFREGWLESDTTTETYNICAALPESEHPYQNNMDYTWTYRVDGNHGLLWVSFDAQTLLGNTDYLHIMDKYGSSVPGSPFNGNVLAGRTIAVPGDTVKIRLDTDGSGTNYGFRVTSIEGNRVAAPVFSLPSGTYSPGRSITLTCATPGAAIHYTTDGRAPTPEDPSVASGASIPITRHMILNARAFMDGYMASEVATAEYALNESYGTLAAPEFNVAGGTIISIVHISIYAMQEATIRYTLDGTEPTESSALYSEPLTIGETTTIKARAFKDGWAPSPVATATYTRVNGRYVHADAPGPIHDGSSWQNAHLSIQSAIDAAAPGEEIWVASGRYSERIVMKSGVALYGGFAGTEVIRQRRDWRTNQACIDGYGTVVTASSTITNAVIDGFTLVNPGHYYNVIRCETSGLTIRNNLILHKNSSYAGIDCSGSAKIENNIIYGKGDALNCHSSAPVISGNLIIGAGDGIGIKCASSSATIFNNTIYMKHYGTYFNAVSMPTALNNIIVNNNIGIYVSGGCKLNLSNNCVYDNTTNYSGIQPGPGDISANPLFINTLNNDFRLHPTSPCLNAGNDTVIQGGWVDLAGNPRLLGEHVDIGAYECSAVAQPTFSPDGGTYTTAQIISIACATPVAEIRYTIDGSEPNDTSPLYTGPVTIDPASTVTLKAKAFKPGLEPSPTATTIYYFMILPAPSFSPDGGVYHNDQTIAISCAMPGAVVHYTTDGIDPTEDSAVYSEPLVLSGTTVVKARAFMADWISGPISSASYTFTAADPVISPDGGTFGEPQTVTIGCGTAGAMVRYTIDGTDPTGTSPEYVGPFIVDAGATVKARAFKAGYTASGITIAAFDFAVAAPVFSPGGGTYHAAQEVSLNCATAGAVIRYTTDGGEPTSTSDEYTGPIIIDANTVLKAKAFRAGWTASPTATASYIFKAPVPTVNPPGGTYNTPLAVTASCADAGAVIRYTTDGTEPTDSSPIHTGPIPVETAAFLKFKAFKPGWNAGETLAVSYTILGRRLSFQPGDGGAHSTLKTAQARRDDPYTQWQGATLSLGRGLSGRPSDLWLWFPQIMGGNAGQVPGTSKIIQAKLVLRLAEIAGDPSKPYRLKIYRITDPDGRGAPAFGTADGLRTGLDFMYRDHRLGMNVRWADGAENILALFADTQPLDAIEFIPAELAAQGIDAIQLDVTAAVQAWMDGASNQGWFVCLDGEWAAGQMLAFHGAAATVQALRPYLEVLYTPAGGDVEPPAAAVSSLSAVTGPGSVALAWINPAADPDFTGVKIVRKPGIVPFDPYDGNLVYDGPGEACADSGLVDGKPYYYAAFAYDGLRNYGPKAWILAVPGTPAAPVLNAATGAGYVQLAWNTVDGADRYRVYRRDGSGTILIGEAASPSYDDFNLSMQPYDYWVTAVKDGCGEGQPSNIVTATPAPASWTPAAPVNLAAASVSNTEIRLTWEDLSDNEVAFALERKRDGEEIWMPVANPAFDTESFVDANLDPGTTYVYRLKAVSWDQESGWTESNPATTGNAPLAPANLTWTVISAGRVNLAWTDRAANETGYRVHVTGGDGSDWTLELSAGAEFCSVTGLRAGVAYRFRVEAWNLDGGSTVESEAVITALDPKDGLL